VDSLDSSLEIFRTEDAKAYAAELFTKRFRIPFPVPRDRCGLSIPTPPENWRQYVATYRWPDGRVETVGFSNWIRYGDAYLQGGLCVAESAYRHMPRQHFAACRARGGIANAIMAKAATEINDCKAWFGYVGDPRSMAVALRAAFERTRHRFILVKWFADLPEKERKSLVASIARIGAF